MGGSASVPAWFCLHWQEWRSVRRWALLSRTSARESGLLRRSPVNKCRKLLRTKPLSLRFPSSASQWAWCSKLWSPWHHVRRWPTSFCSNSGRASVSKVIQKLLGAILAVMRERRSLAASLKRFSPYSLWNSRYFPTKIREQMFPCRIIWFFNYGMPRYRCHHSACISISSHMTLNVPPHDVSFLRVGVTSCAVSATTLRVTDHTEESQPVAEQHRWTQVVYQVQIWESPSDTVIL